MRKNQQNFEEFFPTQPNLSKGSSFVADNQCDQRKSCPKMSSLEKLNILAPTQKLPKTVRDWGKLIVAKGFKKLPKVQ